MDNYFSKRNDFVAKEKNNIIVNEAPMELRAYIVYALKNHGYKPSFLRRIICKSLNTFPDQNNFSEYPNIENEVQILISDCAWFKVYDIIEEFAQNIREKEEFQKNINDFFIDNGIGWKLLDGKILFRGNDAYEYISNNIEKKLNESQFSTAAIEIGEAIKDLSRRPQPDITGAIQHSMACLENTFRVVCGHSNSTLGDLLKHHPNIVPAPLDFALAKIWGFASEQGRHLKEGKNPKIEETELLVGISIVISNYLSSKFGKNPIRDDNDVPF